MKCSKKNSSDDPEEMCILFNLFERQADREREKTEKELFHLQFYSPKGYSGWDEARTLPGYQNPSQSPI